jgi:hypothetical protein
MARKRKESLPTAAANPSLDADSALLFLDLITALSRGEIQQAAGCQMDLKRLGWTVIPGPRLPALAAPEQGGANVA